MSEGTTASLDNELLAETESYLDAIGESVNRVPALLNDYSRGAAARETADEIRALESECDETVRRICGRISNATVEEVGLENTRIHLNVTRIVELYRRLDAVANRVERFAEELVTMAPPYEEPYFRQFREMADTASRAMAALDDAVTGFVRALCSGERSETIDDEIRAIRSAESACDSLRNGLVADVFSDDSIDQPMVFREFALHLDRIVDAMEDVADQIALISCTASWITVERAPVR